MAKQSDFVRYTIRVPGDLYEHVARHADANGRSVNAEIIERLRTVQEMDEYVPGPNAHPDTEHTALSTGFDELPPDFQQALLGFVDTLVKQERKKKR